MIKDERDSKTRQISLRKQIKSSIPIKNNKVDINSRIQKVINFLSTNKKVFLRPKE